MSRLFITLIATSITLGLSAGGATAADSRAQNAPGEPKTIWQSCARVGEPERDRCMLHVPAKDTNAAWQCNEVMGRAQRRCMLDFLEGKVPVAEAK